MLSLVLPIACLVAPAGASAAPAESVQLIGFAQNGELAALAVDVAQPRGEHWDSYRVIQIVDVNTGRARSEFRASELTRINRAGGAVKTRAASLLAQNPRFRRAKSSKAWKRQARRHRFDDRQPLALDDGTLRLRPDEDAPMRGENVVDAMVLEGERGRAVGYTVMVRNADGEKHPVAHFRHDGVAEKTASASLRAVVSYDRRSIAVVNTFAYESAGSVHTKNTVQIARLPVAVSGRTLEQKSENPFPTRGNFRLDGAFRQFIGAYQPFGYTKNALSRGRSVDAVTADEMDAIAHNFRITGGPEE